MSTFADGTGGPNGTASFQAPSGVTVDGAGNLFVADTDNQRIRKLTSNGTTTTLAGNGTVGFFDGTGGGAGTTELNSPIAVAVDGLGFVYVADFGNQRVRKIASDGTTTTFAGNGTQGFIDGTGGAGGTTELSSPDGLALDGSGNLFVADDGNNRIRQLAPNGATTTLSGDGTQGATDGTGGPVGTSEFFNPGGVAVDGSGNLYVADISNNRIRRVAPDGSSLTVTGTLGSGFQNGAGCTAQFDRPHAVAIFGKLLYVADYANNRIRVIQLP